MAKGYRPVPRDQAFLLPPDMRDWLPAGHPVQLVIAVVEEHLDTSAVHAGRRTGGAGAAGYDPDMLTALLVWAYANRVTSSRRIEALCRTDIAFRIICAGDVPDHVTIARFRAGLGGAAGALFDQVLMLCAKLGMGQLGLVTLDGMKIAASASVSANRTEDGLRRLAAQIAAEHAVTDAAEDALLGPGTRGGEVPAGLADPRTRADRITAALADLDADRKAAEAQRDAAAGAYLQAAAAGRPGSGPAGRRGRHRRAAAARPDHRGAAGHDSRVGEAERREGRRDRHRPAQPQAGTRQRALGGQACRRRTGARHSPRRRRAAQSRGQSRRPQGPGPGPQHHRPALAADARPRRRVHPGLQHPERHQRRRPHHRHPPHRQPERHRLVRAHGRRARDAAARITACRPAASSDGASSDGDHDGDHDGEQIGLLLADAGYLSEHNLTIDGPDRLIATGKQPPPPAGRPAASSPPAAGTAPAPPPPPWPPGWPPRRHRRLPPPRPHRRTTPRPHQAQHGLPATVGPRHPPRQPPNGTSPAPSTTCSRPSPPGTSPPAPSPPSPDNRQEAPPGRTPDRHPATAPEKPADPSGNTRPRPRRPRRFRNSPYRGRNAMGYPAATPARTRS